MPEAALRYSEIELPHPAESLVVKRFGLVAPSEEPLAPSLESFGVMQPQDFDVVVKKIPVEGVWTWIFRMGEKPRKMRMTRKIRRQVIWWRGRSGRINMNR